MSNVRRRSHPADREALFACDMPDGGMVQFDGVWYKVGAHGFAYWYDEGVWRRSTKISGDLVLDEAPYHLRANYEKSGITPKGK